MKVESAMKKLLLASALLALGTAAQAGVSTPYADTFEANSIGSNVSVIDWNTNGKVDVLGGSANKFVGLDGGNGESKDLWQFFNLRAGVEYVLSFDMAADCRHCSVDVNFGKENETFRASGDGWQTFSLSFMANKTKDFLVSFANGSGKNREMFIDNVKVAAVPEPETYAMMLAGLGIVGFMARRGRSA
jgi:hypothetical protein